MTERRRAHWSDDLIEKVRYVYNSQITYADHDEEMSGAGMEINKDGFWITEAYVEKRRS